MDPPNVERKLTTILCADVAGYGRLMGAREEATLHALKDCMRVIGSHVADHRGRIFASAGDSVMAEFPSAVGAVRCAVEIQDALAALGGGAAADRRMRFRIGINLGDVMVEGEDLLGEGVNVAARLQVLAEEGGICISGDAYRQVRGKIELGFADMGEREVKNIAEPVRVYRVLSEPVHENSAPVKDQTRATAAHAPASPHILIVDDDREIRDLLARFLAKHGYRVEVAADGRAMRKALADWRIDLIVLDLMLPGEDGLVLCRRLRAESSIPVIMLTAMGEDIDRIIGLEIGADDYVSKPFNPRELLARIKAVLRRAGEPQTSRGAHREGTALAFAGWRLDPAARKLTAPDGADVALTAGEFELLAALVEHPQRVMSREQLLDLTRGREAAPFDRSIDVQVSRLRRKLETDPSRPELIKTVRNGGYVFAAAVEPR